MGVAAFNYLQWAALYPELAAKGATLDLATANWAIAGLYLDNSECSPVADVTRRGLYLGMVLAHLLALSPACGGTGLVGRVTNAAEGSVSVAADYGTQVRDAAFWLQSPYGAQYWAVTAYLRTARYIAAPPSPAQFPAGFYISPGGRGWPL